MTARTWASSARKRNFVWVQMTRRFYAFVVHAALASAGVVLFAACPATSEDVRPPAAQFFFPTGMAILPDQSKLFVVNANSDLRYDSGAIHVVDLVRVGAVANDWVMGGGVPADIDCNVDNSVRYTLVCDEEEFVLAEATIRIGNFATDVAVQPLSDGTSRLFAAVRGDPSVSWADYNASSDRLECGGTGAVARCDDQHRLTRIRNDESLASISVEPFELYIDSLSDVVVATHLRNGAITLIDAPADGSAPIVSDAVGGIFARDSVTGVSSALGVSARTPGGRIYVTSRSESRVQMFTVARFENSLPVLVPSEYFFLNGVSPADDGRGIDFSSSGDTAYVINRAPAMLQVIDTGLDTTGVPRNELRRVIELCSSASNLAAGDLGDGDRIYVTCFSEGQVWVVNAGAGRVEAIIETGRGPQNVVLSLQNKQLYVSNYLEDTIAVISVDPESMTENRVVMKIGQVRQSRGN